MAVRHASHRSPEKERSMSSTQRRWAAAPGGICAGRDPCNRGQAPIARAAPATWGVIARQVLEVARAAPAISGMRPPAPSGSAVAEASSGRS